MNAFARQSIQHLRQHFARFENDGLFGAVGSNQHLPQGLCFPGHRFERARDQAPQRVRVTVVEAVVTDLEQPALHAQQHAVLRQLERAAGRDFFQHLYGITLAVEVPGNVQGNQVDITHLGVALAKGTHFGEQIRAGSIHHGCSLGSSWGGDHV